MLFTKYISFILLLSISGSFCAQNNVLVLDGAYIVLDGGSAASSMYVVIDEPSDQGIVRLGGGHIHSENQYHYVKWLNTNGTGGYLFPFGVNGADYIPFTFQKTAGGMNDILVSTWSTNQANLPFPAATNVGAVTVMNGTTDPIPRAIDRFWDIQSPAPVTADLTFSYRGIENTTINPNGQFFAQHWNGTAWDPQVGPGTPGVIAGVGNSGIITGQTTFSPWVLTTCDITYGLDTLAICENDSALVGGAFQTDSGDYNDTLFNANYMGCDSIVTTHLIVNPNPVANFTGINLEGCSPICPEIISTSTIDNPSSLTQFEWELGNTIVQNGASSSYGDCIENNGGSTQFYDLELRVTSSEGCADTFLVTDYIKIYHTPIAQFNFNPAEPDVMNTEVQFMNTSSFADFYNWIFQNVGTSSLVNPTFDFPTEADDYLVYLIATTQEGCADTTSTVVSIKDHIVFYVPNTFTPDGDGSNNIFQPVFTAGFEPQDINFLIFNRWGEIVYETNNINKGWDGSYNNQLAPEGTYVWKIEFTETMSDKRHIEVGHINLLR